MVELDYFIIYTNDGIPIYSYQFDKQFHISDDVLLSAFLATLNLFAKVDRKTPTNVNLEEFNLELEYSEELQLSSIHIEDTVLVFYYADEEELTIGVGVNKENFNNVNALFEISQMLVDTEKFMKDYATIIWNDIDQQFINEFEYRLLSTVVHNFVDSHTDTDDCFLGEKCPFKIADEKVIEKDSFRSRFINRFRGSN